MFKTLRSHQSVFKVDPIRPELDSLIGNTGRFFRCGFTEKNECYSVFALIILFPEPGLGFFQAISAQV